MPLWISDRNSTKFTEARRRLKHAVEDLGINFSTPEILRSTAGAKHVEAFVRESGIRIWILFTPALALQDLAVIQCHSPLIIIIITVQFVRYSETRHLLFTVLTVRCVMEYIYLV